MPGKPRLGITEGSLSRGMAWLNSVYTQKFNRKYGLTGHLFQGRFKSKPVEDNMQFLMAARYIVRNPLEANIVESSERWPWSSYRATVGKITPPEYLFVDDILSCLSTDRRNARLYFQELVEMDLKKNDDQVISLFQKVYTGEREPVFSRRIQTVLDMRNSLGPVPRNQRIRQHAAADVPTPLGFLLVSWDTPYPENRTFILQVSIVLLPSVCLMTLPFSLWLCPLIMQGRSIDPQEETFL